MVSDSIDLYAEQWSKQEQVDLKYLSEWKDQIKELVVERISSLKEKIRSPKQKILNDPDVKDTLRRLHDDFVLVPADKTANNVIVVCKKYYIETLTPPILVPTPHIFHQLTHLMKFLIVIANLSNQWDQKCLKKIKIFLTCTGLQNYTRSLSNIALLLAPVSVPQKICHACSPKC